MTVTAERTKAPAVRGRTRLDRHAYAFIAPSLFGVVAFLLLPVLIVFGLSHVLRLGDQPDRRLLDHPRAAALTAGQLVFTTCAAYAFARMLVRSVAMTGLK